ncbi:MAG TPA: HD domain-containing protein, partial [Gemmatales bacterium]|nr:HD domain-containing protein [Gemmatales bacterium]
RGLLDPPQIVATVMSNLGFERFLGDIGLTLHSTKVGDRYVVEHMRQHGFNLGGEEHQAIRVGTPLHDIGKIGIDDSILRKPGRLTETEFETMKLHTTMGAAIIESIPDLLPVLPIVRNHHEAWNGTGYPDQMAGEKIPYLARIVAVADTFDAMTSSRPYRPALDIDEAFEEIRAQAGLQFDPAVVQAFLNRRDLITDARNERLAAEQADAELFGSIEEEAADTAGPPTAAIKSRPADEVPFMD